jgi:hypothetical protein
MTLSQSCFTLYYSIQLVRASDEYEWINIAIGLSLWRKVHRAAIVLLNKHVLRNQHRTFESLSIPIDPESTGESTFL